VKFWFFILKTTALYVVLNSHACCMFRPSYPSQFECPKVNIRRVPPFYHHFFFRNPTCFPKHVVIKVCPLEWLLFRPQPVHFGTEQYALGLDSSQRRPTVLLTTDNLTLPSLKYQKCLPNAPVTWLAFLSQSFEVPISAFRIGEGL